MTRKCITTATVFDYDAFIKACADMSVLWYVWQPPGLEHLRFERYFLDPPTPKTTRDLKRLYEWAGRTDSDWAIRRSRVRMTWENRRPGENVAFAA